MLLTSELVTNVIRHTQSDCELVVSLEGETLRIEAWDEGPGWPVLRYPPPEGESGRGLVLVEMLARGWGTDAIPGGGKRVWFELAVPTTSSRRAAAGDGAGTRAGRRR